MNRCTECEIVTAENTCPLCHKLLSEDRNTEETRAYPVYDQQEYKMRARISRLAIIGGILATLICYIVNLIVMQHFMWVFYVAGAVYYHLDSLHLMILSAYYFGGEILKHI